MAPVEPKKSAGRSMGQPQESWEQVNSPGASLEGLHSPTSLVNSSFGLASFLQLPSQISSTSTLQIERGAELLDQLANEVNEHLDQFDIDEHALLRIRYDAGSSLLDGLKDVSHGIVNRMQQQQTEHASRKLSNTWKQRIRSLEHASGETSCRQYDDRVDLPSQTPEDEEYRKAQGEYNTWELLSRVLDIRKPKVQADGLDMNDSIRNFLDTRGLPHWYTQTPELWERFLLENASAREKKVILDWLQGCSSTHDPLDKLLSHIGEVTHQPDMVWTDSHQSTRSKIKLEKIKRRLTSPLELANLRSSNNVDALVHQLDPDAVARQSRTLEPIDNSLDNAVWLACFAMLRQGTSWNGITTFLEERGQGWRAAALGMAVNEQQSRTSLSGAHAGSLWRRMCLTAARHKNFDPYQRAVYGILAGDVKSTDPVCFSFDDKLYVRYNASLLQDFEAFLHNQVPERYVNEVTHMAASQDHTHVQEHASIDILLQVDRLLQNLDPSSDDHQDPLKLLQASIIADNFETLITNLGIIIAKQANSKAESRLLPPLDDYTYDVKYECLAGDFDVIRLIVHIFAVYEYVGYEFPEPFRHDAIEYVVIAYIDHLRLQRKFEPIPTYAALLSPERRHRTLGIVCVDISDPSEQDRLIQLISRQNVNLAQVVTEQYIYAASLMGFLNAEWKSITSFALLEPTRIKHWPGTRIRRHFEPQDLSFEEDRLVRSVTWYIFIDSTWRDTFYGLCYAMRILLLSGMFSGALQVTKQVPYRAVSLKLTPALLGRAVDVLDEDPKDTPASFGHGVRRSTRANSRQIDQLPDGVEEKSEQEIFMTNMLRAQCRQYFEMQQICLVLEQLSFWKDFEEVVIRKDFTPDIRKELQSLLEDLKITIRPLLHGFMTEVENVEDEAHYVRIRQLYVPSIFIAYASAQTFAASYLGPEVLLPVLDLAATLADEANTALAQDFVRMGQMKQFVHVVAAASTALIQLNQERAIGGKKKPASKSRSWTGATVDIFSMNMSL